jgi:hypothetical protein
MFVLTFCFCIQKSESGRAGTKTIETIKSGEKIIEALELVKIENENLDLYHQEIKRWVRSAHGIVSTRFNLTLSKLLMILTGGGRIAGGREAVGT